MRRCPQAANLPPASRSLLAAYHPAHSHACNSANYISNALTTLPFKSSGHGSLQENTLTASSRHYNSITSAAVSLTAPLCDTILEAFSHYPSFDALSEMLITQKSPLSPVKLSLPIPRIVVATQFYEKAEFKQREK